MENKILFFVPLFFDNKKNTGVNFYKKTNILDTYLKNACVCLISSKLNNPNVDVFLFTNFTIPDEYKTILEKFKIQIKSIVFSDFIFDDTFKWSSAFYKLNCLEYVTKHFNNYEHIVYTDADVYVQCSFDELINETKGKILLLDLCENLNNSIYRNFCEIYRKICPNMEYPIHYGGEFFAADAFNAKRFIELCKKFYIKIIDEKICFDTGDELISSLAGNNLPNVKNAGAYVFRFWTGRFRLISSRFKFNPVCFLHCPDQKERGFIKIYSFILKKNKLPANKKVHKILKLSSVGIKTSFLIFASFLLKKKIKTYE